MPASPGGRRADRRSGRSPATARSCCRAAQPAIIQFAALNVSGTRASGALRSDPGGFTGVLDVAGGGLDGRLQFNPFSGPPADRGQPRRPTTRASSGRRRSSSGAARSRAWCCSIRRGPRSRAGWWRAGLSRGPLSIANVDATASLRGGVGQVRARVAGSRGRDFAFNIVADVAPGRYRVSGSGTLDRRPLELVSPAELTWQAEGWRLAPTRFRFAGGNASLVRPVRHAHRDRRAAASRCR